MLVAAFFLGRALSVLPAPSAVKRPRPLDCIGAGPKTTKCWWMRTPRRDPDTRQAPLLFHGSVIKITRGSGQSFRSVRLAFRQPHQPIAGDDRAAWCHFHAAQRHQLANVTAGIFREAAPRSISRAISSNATSSSGVKTAGLSIIIRWTPSTIKRPPSRGGPRKGGADGGANLEDQTPPSDRYGDSPNRFH
jgi:hypothetical protein